MLTKELIEDLNSIWLPYSSFKDNISMNNTFLMLVLTSKRQPLSSDEIKRLKQLKMESVLIVRNTIQSLCIQSVSNSEAHSALLFLLNEIVSRISQIAVTHGSQIWKSSMEACRTYLFERKRHRPFMKIKMRYILELIALRANFHKLDKLDDANAILYNCIVKNFIAIKNVCANGANINDIFSLFQKSAVFTEGSVKNIDTVKLKKFVQSLEHIKLLLSVDPLFRTSQTSWKGLMHAESRPETSGIISSGEATLIWEYVSQIPFYNYKSTNNIYEEFFNVEEEYHAFNLVMNFFSQNKTLIRNGKQILQYIKTSGLMLHNVLENCVRNPKLTAVLFLHEDRKHAIDAIASFAQHVQNTKSHHILLIPEFATKDSDTLIMLLENNNSIFQYIESGIKLQTIIDTAIKYPDNLCAILSCDIKKVENISQKFLELFLSDFEPKKRKIFLDNFQQLLHFLKNGFELFRLLIKLKEKEEMVAIILQNIVSFLLYSDSGLFLDFVSPINQQNLHNLSRILGLCINDKNMLYMSMNGPYLCLSTENIDVKAQLILMDQDTVVAELLNKQKFYTLYVFKNNNQFLFSNHSAKSICLNLTLEILLQIFQDKIHSLTALLNSFQKINSSVDKDTHFRHLCIREFFNYATRKNFNHVTNIENSDISQSITLYNTEQNLKEHNATTKKHNSIESSHPAFAS